jgi:hypothetical protein
MPPGAPLQFSLIWLACLTLVWLPGKLLARAVRLPTATDWPLRTSLEIGLGLAFWPLLLLWSNVVFVLLLPAAWTSASARIFVAAIAIVAAGLLAKDVYRRAPALRRSARRQALWLSLFGFQFLLAVATRWQHTRTLVLPNWVDSVHHVMIVRLIVEQGALPGSYTPFIPDSVFSYHWGFHAVTAWLAWLLGVSDPFELSGVMLISGQILNVAMLWALYAAGRALFNSRRAGFLAAAMGMFVSWLPAYYTAWGRYTHLAGILLAVPCLIALWRLGVAGKKVPGWWAVVALTAAGLALTHVRVAAFAAVFAALLLVWLIINRQWRAIPRWGSAAVAALLLIAPWLIQLASHPRLPQTLLTVGAERLSWSEAAAQIPWRLVWVPGMNELAALASGGLSELLAGEHPSTTLYAGAALWLVALVAAGVWHRLRPRARNTFPWAGLALPYGWSAAVFLLLNTQVAGLPRIAFLSLGAAAITFFAPVSLSAAGLVTWATGVFIPLRWLRTGSAALTVAVAVWGAANMRDIINPRTVLVDAEDLPALRWIRDNTPPDARFAVDTWRWQGNTYAGADAGYWISVLADRQSIVPPALYTLTASREAVLDINRFLEQWTDLQSVGGREMIDAMRDGGVTHLFVGHRARHLDAEQLAQSPDLEVVYDVDSVYVFRLKDRQEPTP